ncbi:hypothetical protein [Alkalibacillus haloalkaliphilus]|uniref:hypothetical protein n=1 Tax=Alkalibacillus haloalkaliphilus TaxID=94136 RepID=UPI000317E640|nr:hypothetical protein [Alkalibacillus haloalkaliphilus]
MLPEYQTFLDSENMDSFWEMVRWLMFFIAPVIMIFFAADAIKLLVKAIRKGLGMEKADQDDDYDIYRY